MADPVKITKTIFGKNTFPNVVDTKFNQLVSPESDGVSTPVDVKGFFGNYNDLFYDIPQSGSYSGSIGYSHLDLVNRSSDYIGISITDMESEIMQLRSENVALRQQIFTLTLKSGSLVTG
jgi:hypothetical protein